MSASSLTRSSALYFASGSSRAADIRGFAAVGHPIGVAAHEISPAAERELVALAGTGLPVFVDSGAFSEIEFGPEGPKVVDEITDEDWRARLALYRRLAVALGPQVYLVAPDCVGNQDETLRRLATYADEVRELRALGAQILVPIQRGAKRQAVFYREIVEVLGFNDFIHAIPSKKKATTAAELEAYVAEIKPRKIHLLGMGIKNAGALAALATIETHSPGCVVSLDSNMIAANVGRGLKPRRLTLARDEAARLIAEGVAPDTLSLQELGIVLAFGTPEQIGAFLKGANMKIYLCGPINGCSDEEAKGWRREAADLLTYLGHEPLDPMRRDYRGREAENFQSIVREDLVDIDVSDALLCYTPRPSYGTAMEIFYAHRAGKRVAICVPTSAGPPSPWLLAHADAVVPTISEAVAALVGRAA